MEQQTLFKVRDLRQKDQFKIDDAYLNGYAKICGKYSTLVYVSLCRHAEFNTQKAFPAQELMAKQHNISVKSVRVGIKNLIEYNIIFAKLERNGGKFANYVYYLIDKSEWVKHRRNETTYGSPSANPAIRSKTTTVERPTKDNKVYKDNKVLYKDNKSLIEKIPFSLKDKELTELLYSLVKQNYSFLKDKSEIQLQSDYIEMNRLHKIDGFNYEQISWIIKWATQDDFWKQNIRCVSKLRKQFKSLIIKAKGEHDKQNKNGVLVL